MRRTRLLAPSALLLAVACARAPALRAPVVSTTASSAAVAAPPPSAAAALSCRRGTERLLASLDSPMHVEAFVTKGLPQLDAFVAHLESILERDTNDGAGRFDYRIIVADDDAAKKRAKEAGLVEQTFAEATDATHGLVTQGYMGLVFRYGGAVDLIKFFPPDRTDGMEFWITNKVRELRDRVDGVHHTIGVLTGHGEIALSEANLVSRDVGSYSMEKIITQNFPFYRFEDVDLAGGDRAVPADLEGLILTQPSSEVTEKELRRIDDFVLEGKSLVAYVSAVNVGAGDASMSAPLDAHGLDKLFGGYGIELRRDAVVDFGSPLHVEVGMDRSVARMAFPAFLQVSSDDHRLDTTFPPLFRMEGVVVPFASSVVLHPDKQPEATLRVVARTSPHATRRVGSTVRLDPFQRWNRGNDETGAFGVAAASEGSLRSAFGGGGAGSDHPARVFVMASSQFLTNPLVRAGTTPRASQSAGDEKLVALANVYARSVLTTTILEFKDALDWMIGESDILACASTP